MLHIILLMRRVNSVKFFMLLCVVLAAVGTGRLASAADADAGTLFREVEERFADLSALSYSVKRVSESRAVRAEERWTFRFAKPDRVRIDYREPHERIIIIDAESLWEYIPELRKAVRTDLTRLDKDKRGRLVAEVMARVSIDGLRLAKFDELEKKAVRVRKVSWSGADAFLIEGADPRYAVYIDRQKKTLLRTEIYDRKGGLTLRTEASSFVEAAQNFWMPREVRATYATQAGFVQSTAALSDIKINDVVTDDLFRFSAPKGVEVISK